MYESTDGIFIIQGDDGKDIECHLLFSFESENTGKVYIVYTDGSTDENGNLSVFASAVEEYINDEDVTFSAITTQAEWAEIDEKLEEYLREE
ncbi:MAG: DUF1292 domain-containing protein [Oscillospiraceae bacterium]|nr:DUF1292 domain-containing protein [Oscillospiraceae bacterium]